MPIVRRLARPMLAAIFVAGGLEALRDPEPRAKLAGDVAARFARPLGLPEDAETLVKINAATQIAAGGLLATGHLPRLSSTVLAASLIPTTLGGHAFWASQTQQDRKHQRTQFLKNLGLLGGLMLSAVDTEGRPGLAWRTRHATKHVAHTVGDLSHSVGDVSHKVGDVSHKVGDLSHTVSDLRHRVSDRLPG
jgi:putative oxidoreductase